MGSFAALLVIRYWLPVSRYWLLVALGFGVTV